MLTECQFVKLQINKIPVILSADRPRYEKIARVISVELMAKVDVVDISQWWPVGEDGQPLSVYAVHKQIEDEPFAVTRHTLTRARDGQLEKIAITNLKNLAQICSIWARRKITVDEIIKER